MSLDQYSQTPASNDMANYFQTGMRPSAVKIAGWDVMADLAMRFGLPTSSGTANAQTITNTRQYGSLVAGLVGGTFIPGFTNTGAMTLQVDGLTAKNCFANGVAAIAGMIVAGVPCQYLYDGTNINILNPQRSTGSFTITLTGMTAGTTGTVNYAIGNDGKTVYIYVTSDIANTSNTTSMTGTGIPSILSPITSKTPICILEDTATRQISNLLTGISTTWTFRLGASILGTSFTASSTKGFMVCEFSYTLD